MSWELLYLIAAIVAQARKLKLFVDSYIHAPLQQLQRNLAFAFAEVFITQSSTLQLNYLKALPRGVSPNLKLCSVRFNSPETSTLFEVVSESAEYVAKEVQFF